MNVFIIGSKGIPAQYGGFESFVEKLTELSQEKHIQYHISCLADNNSEFYHNGARCFNVHTPNIGSAKAILYDIKSLSNCYNYIKKNNLKDCVVYILACRMGHILAYFKKKLMKYNVKVYVNPDGHEWKRSKWNKLIRWYWKYSEAGMIKQADLVICDSKGIETYIQKEYVRYKPSTKYISYGADLEKSKLQDDSPYYLEWLHKFNLNNNQYYLIVGRFVSENNYLTIIKEFMMSETKRDLVIITNVKEDSFYKNIQKNTGFEQDNRVKFVGTVYDQNLLKKIRENAFGYFHGHEVGGTNPSLLEALASTKLNFLLDVVFNKEVGAEGALYFTKKPGQLADHINKAEQLNEDQIADIQKLALERITNHYVWKDIIDQYESLFLPSKICNEMSEKELKNAVGVELY